MKKISIISPVFENVNRISETMSGLIDFFKDKYEFEVFYYHTADLPENLLVDSRFTFFKVDKKKSHDDCVTDGFEKATGDCVIVADLNNIECKDYILKMLVEWENKAQIVMFKRDKRSLNFWQKIGNFFKGIGRALARMLMSFANLNKSFQAEKTFQLFSKNVVELIKQFPNKNYYLRNFDCWVDFRVSVVYINKNLKVKRKQKKSVPSLWAFIVSTVLFAGLLATLILTTNLIPEINRKMFVFIGVAILAVFVIYSFYNLFKYAIYRMTNLKGNYKD